MLTTRLAVCFLVSVYHDESSNLLATSPPSHSVMFSSWFQSTGDKSTGIYKTSGCTFQNKGQNIAKSSIFLLFFNELLCHPKHFLVIPLNKTCMHIFDA